MISHTEKSMLTSSQILTTVLYVNLSVWVKGTVQIIFVTRKGVHQEHMRIHKSNMFTQSLFLCLNLSNSWIYAWLYCTYIYLVPSSWARKDWSFAFDPAESTTWCLTPHWDNHRRGPRNTTFCSVLDLAPSESWVNGITVRQHTTIVYSGWAGQRLMEECDGSQEHNCINMRPET